MPRVTVADADPVRRREFLDAQRESWRVRYDIELASGYDEVQGVIPDSHRRFIDHLTDRLAEGASVLDAGCGTGRLWPLLSDADLRIVGVDQSQRMLDIARGKHPDVDTRCVSLQDLPFLHEFDAVVCVDVLENIGPEDWPLVLDRLQAAGRPDALVYLTVGLADDEDPLLADDAADFGEPLVDGEAFDGERYRYLPERKLVIRWLDDAGLDVVHEAEADGYRHLLVRRR